METHAHAEVVCRVSSHGEYLASSFATEPTHDTEKTKGRAIARQAPEVFGRPCRDRTYDQRIKSPLLYQLS